MKLVHCLVLGLLVLCLSTLARGQNADSEEIESPEDTKITFAEIRVRCVFPSHCFFSIVPRFAQSRPCNVSHFSPFCCDIEEQNVRTIFFC
jgi:hypothetical protein